MQLFQFIYFCKTLYMFQTVFPSIIKSSWWWMEKHSETCRASYRKNKLRKVASCWLYFESAYSSLKRTSKTFQGLHSRCRQFFTQNCSFQMKQKWNRWKNSFVKLINIEFTENRLLWPMERPVPVVQTESPSRDTSKRRGQEIHTNYLKQPQSVQKVMLGGTYIVGWLVLM